ncbi:MAG: hypothetical protein ACREER_09555, partial [Alphaproteobacteria bacterium]
MARPAAGPLRVLGLAAVAGLPAAAAFGALVVIGRLDPGPAALGWLASVALAVPLWRALAGNAARLTRFAEALDEPATPPAPAFAPAP